MISSDSTDGEWVRTLDSTSNGAVHCLKPDNVGVSEEDVWYTATYQHPGYVVPTYDYIDFRVGCDSGSGNTIVFYLAWIANGSVA